MSRKRVTLVFLGLVVVFGAAGLWGLVPVGVRAEALDDLRAELEEKKEALDAAEERIQQFKEEVVLKRKEARSLEEQIDIIENNITQIRLSIDQTIAEIEKTEVEIEKVKEEIFRKEEEIAHQKDLLSEYIRSIYARNSLSTVTVFLKYATFSEAVNETSTLHELQTRSHEALVTIKQLRDELEEQRGNLEDFRKTLEELQVRQEHQQATLVTNRESKETILDVTRQEEERFADLLEGAKQAHQAAEATIRQIDARIREELKARGIDSLPSVGQLDWPVQPIFGISCGFHCPGYPYAYLIGAHSGIDVPTYVGTPIAAPADGYVARVHNAQGPGYNYILLVHGDNVSTVYGHVSGFAVSEGELVTRGTVIGFTGGAPGTNGAGLSSGPHLHFEVRVNNAPVDPQSYL